MPADRRDEQARCDHLPLPESVEIDDVDEANGERFFLARCDLCDSDIRAGYTPKAWDDPGLSWERERR